MLQSIYVPVKGVLASTANCEDAIDHFLTAFTVNVRALAKEKVAKAVEQKISTKKKIALKIKKSDVELTQLDHDYHLANVSDSVVYFISGFVLRNVSQFTKCQTCCKSFTSQKYVSKNAMLVAIKDYGNYMQYPSDAFVDIMLQAEKSLETKLLTECMWESTFDEIIADLDITVHKGICCSEEHMDEVIPKLIYYYLQTRCYFKCREMRQELTDSRKVNAARKLSKI